MRRYPEYKNSGVEWIGKIPQNWEVLKVKHVSLSNPSKNNPKAECFKRQICGLPSNGTRSYRWDD